MTKLGRVGGSAVLAAVSAVFLFSGAGVAGAELPGPKRAGRIISSFVQAFEECTNPNDTTTGALALPACNPAVPIDSTCSFGPEGKGTGRAYLIDGATAAEQDIRINGRLVGLGAGCEGETLCITVSVVVSAVGCAGGGAAGCTMETLRDFQLGSPPGSGCGVVQDGTVGLRSTIDTALGADVINSRTNIQLRGIGIRRVSSVNSAAPMGNTFEAGLLVPKNPPLPD